MTRHTVLLTRRWPSEAEDAMVTRYEVRRNLTDRPMSRKAIAAAMQDFDFVCPTVTDRLDAAVLTGTTFRARAICNFGAGVSHIDLAACASTGLIVTNTPDVLTDDTADLAIMLALMCARRAGEGERLVRGGGWTGWAPTHHLGSSLAGKTMGIVGFGRIGQATAKRARYGLGLNIVYASRRPADADIADALSARRLSLDHLFGEADLISLHLPGGAANRHLVDSRRLSLMKTSAILINTSRGELIDEGALVEALSHGQIASAGLDVYEDEPHLSPALLRLENAVLLPHLGSATQETRMAMGLRVLANLDAIVAGEAAPDQVA